MLSRTQNFYTDYQGPRQYLYYNTLTNSVDDESSYQREPNFSNPTFGRQINPQYYNTTQNYRRSFSPNFFYRNDTHTIKQNNNQNIKPNIYDRQSNVLNLSYINTTQNPLFSQTQPLYRKIQPLNYQQFQQQRQIQQQHFNIPQNAQNYQQRVLQYQQRHLQYQPIQTIQNLQPIQNIQQVNTQSLQPQTQIPQNQFQYQEKTHNPYEPQNNNNNNNNNNNEFIIDDFFKDTKPFDENNYNNNLNDNEQNEEIHPLDAFLDSVQEIPNNETSNDSFDIISAFGCNSYNGLVRHYNEDKIKIIIDVNNNTQIFNFPSNNLNNLKVSYFAIFDGHGGDKCCEFLKNNFHYYIFRSQYFPSNILQAIYEAFKNCEKDFTNFAYKNNKLNDRSGSCAIIALIINTTCYLINLGDSRALYSCDSGKQLYQISRDQKPEDPKEKERIIQNGGSIYKADFIDHEGVRYSMKNMDYGRNFKFPFRLLPGKLSVSIL